MSDTGADPRGTARTPWGVGALLFGSGLAALVYQIAWTRELRLVFGASTAATAAVLAVFVGGLGAGGLLFGSRADRAERPLALYGVLELGAALLAAVSPLLLSLVRGLYVALGGSVHLGLALGTVLRLLLSAVVLAGPTLCMGGAMPAAVAAVENEEDAGRRRLALVYGLNTLGAVAGCLVATFFLLERLGTRATLLAASGLGAAMALTALTYSRSRPHPVGDGEQRVPACEPSSSAPTFVLVASAIVGFAFFLMEMVWYRMLGPLLGGTVFSFGTILAVALFGIGMGSVLHGTLRSRGHLPATLSGFAAVCLAEAIAVAVPFALGDRVALLALFTRPVANLGGFAGHVASWGLIAGVVVLPAAVASGVQFPMLIALLGRGRADVGRQTGRAYAANTVGAIAGSLAGGFGLLPLLTAPGCWQLAAGLLAGLAMAGLWLSQRQKRIRVVAVAGWLAGAALLIVLLTADGPSAVWRHSPIAVGRVDPASLGDAIALRDFESRVRRSIERESEGVESSVALDHSTGYAFILNGKTDGHARMDAATQVMGGLLGAFLHPHPRNAFVIGLGTGSTSGWLAALPSIEQVDTVELEPAIVEVARRCAAVNHDVLANPKHHVIIGDARETLLGKGKVFDIIASEPSNPYRAGIASLFTREYYQAVDRRLAEGGIFLQWVQAYAIDSQTLTTIMATLAQVFSSVEIWRMAPSDLLLVATRSPLVHDLPLARARMQEEPFRSAFAGAWSTTSLEGVFSHHLARPSFVRRIAEHPDLAINTDDRTRVEFGFARSITGRSTVRAADVEALAHEHGDDRPVVQGGALDDHWIADERVSFAASLGIARPAVSKDQDQRIRHQVLAEWVAGRYAGVPALWRRQPLAPRTLMEQTALADALAELGDEEALAIAERLHSVWPAVAFGIEARLRHRQGKNDDAARAFERSLIAYRSDPWPPPTFMLRTLNLAVSAARERRLSPVHLFQILRLSFAAHMMDEARANARVELSKLIPVPAACAEALAYFESDVPWNADFLRFRLDCYHSERPDLAETARSDLAWFLDHSPTKLSALLQ